jgi:uncharacterized protein (DUF1778 family)
MSQHLEDKSEFVATPKQWRVLNEILVRPARPKPELARLFSERQKQDFTTQNTESTE